MRTLSRGPVKKFSSNTAAAIQQGMQRDLQSVALTLDSFKRHYPAFGYQSSKRTSILVPASAFWNAARSVGGLAR
jgi:hypothetical protein